MTGSIASDAATGPGVGPVSAKRVFVVVMLLGLACACNRPSSIAVDPPSMFLKRTGEQQRLVVRLRDDQGREVEKGTFSMTALTPDVIAVDTRSGMVTALKSGDGAVLVKAGDLSKTVSVRVQIAVRVDISPADPVMNLGVSRALVATVVNDRGDPIVATKPIRWSVSDPSVVSVDANGVIKTLKEGEALVTGYTGEARGETTITVQHEKYDERRGGWGR